MTLDDFVGWKTSKEFGKSVYRRSLAEIIKGNNVELAGAGGNWPRSNERFNRSIVKQADDISCVAAAGEMLAKTYNLPVTQETILENIGRLANSEKLSNYLNSIDETGDWSGHHIDPNDQRLKTKVETTKALLAILRESSPLGHAVLVRGVNKSGRVKIDDPWDQTSYNMTWDDFLKSFSEIVYKK